MAHPHAQGNESHSGDSEKKDSQNIPHRVLPCSKLAWWPEKHSKPTSRPGPSPAARGQSAVVLIYHMSTLGAEFRTLTDLYSCRTWVAIENKVASGYSSKYEPFPIPEEPLFTSKDVSVVALLLSPPKIFELCLRSWLKNQPREVVLVTTFDYGKPKLSGPVTMSTCAPPTAARLRFTSPSCPLSPRVL